MRGPIGGHFTWEKTDGGPLLLLGGGSGVVPLMAIARQHAATSSSAPLRLVHSVRTPEALLYADELATLAKAPAVEVTHVFTRTAPDGWSGPVGRLDDARLRDLAFPPDQQPTSYVCGPTGFVEAAAQIVMMSHRNQRLP